MSVLNLSLRVCFTVVTLIGLASIPIQQAAAQTLSTVSHSSAINAQRGPLARLVRNPNPAGELPPYALTDQAGTVQRYVEPVPGIDLESYLGMIVTVRHDTGRTLLASQLDFPQLPPGARGMATGHVVATGSASGVYQAQHVEQIEALPPGAEILPEGTMSLDPAGTAGNYPPGVEPVYLDSLPPGMSASPGTMMPPEMGACPTCGMSGCGACGMGPSPSCSIDETFGCGDAICGAPPCGCRRCSQPEPWRLYADAEVSFLRLHLTEGTIGKLSEHYELSPRAVVGIENSPWLSARARYWRYEETTRILAGDEVRFELDVIDVEATSCLQGRRTDVVLAGGVRWAGVDVNLPLGNGFATSNDLLGLTLAADVKTRVLRNRLGQLGIVYGGRLSLLGGDWDGDFPVRDDNVLVHEFYGGVDYMRCFPRCDFHARVTAEWQTWRSDAFAQGEGELAPNGIFQSLGFFGPACQVGITF